jgi:hypothetical protein
MAAGEQQLLQSNVKGVEAAAVTLVQQQQLAQA